MNAIVPYEPEVETVEGTVITGNCLWLETNPFSTSGGRYVDGVPEGSTLDAYVERAAEELPAAYAGHLEVWLGENVIEPRFWHRIKPRPGVEVYIRVRPRGKTGKNVLRVVAIVGIVALATAFMPGLVTALGVAATSTAGAALVAAGTALAVTVGTLAVNALIPPPGLTADPSTRDPRYQITGTSNRFNPYGPVPRVYGETRLYPVLAARPYTEIVGKNQFLRLLLAVGWGPLEISDIRIGNTPITAFEGVQTEVTQGGPDGWGGNVPITLYNRKVTEQQLNVQTLPSAPTAFQTTAPDTVEISVDIAFPQGLVSYTKSGAKGVRAVNHTVEYRVAGSGGGWSPANFVNDWDDNTSGSTITVSGNSQDVERATARFKVTKGQYEVRVTRTTSAGTQTPGGTNQIDTSYWTALRSFADDKPVVQDNLCLIAVRIKATDQLNGVPDQINCLAKAYVPVYSGGVWTFTKTRSPAWAYTDIMRRRAGQTLIADNRIDLPAIMAWDADCAATAPNAAEPRWTFDGVLEGGSVIGSLRQVAAIGRAGFNIKDGKFSVIQDKPQATPVQLITPRNSWGYSGTRTYLDQPHAFKVEFQNNTKDYRTDEQYVYADGYSAANATRFETMQLFGGTSPTLVWREARYHLAVSALRPEEHQVSMDVEGLRCAMGDRVELAHDVILVGTGYGRVAGRLDASMNPWVSGTVSGLSLDNEVIFEASKTYQLRVRHADGTTSIRAVTAPGGALGSSSTVVLAAAEAAATAPNPEDVFMFGETGLVSAPMLVKRIEPGDDLSVRLSLVPYDPAIYTADTGTIPPFSSFMTVRQSGEPPAVPIVATRSDDTVTDVMSDGTLINRLAIDIGIGLSAAPGAPGAEGFEAQWRPVYSKVWADLGFWPANTTTIYATPVRDGASYQVRVRARGTNGLYSAWSQPADVTITGKAIAPDPPTAPVLTAGYREVYATWTNPADLDLAFVEVLASQTNSIGTAVVVGRTATGRFTHANLAAGDTWYYWVRAVDTSGNTSTATAAGSALVLSIADYEGIGADNVVTADEKKIVNREFNDLTNEKAGIDAQAAAMSIATEKTAYDNAYAALNTYLGGLSPAMATAANTTIVRATWNTNWQAVYSARQALLNKIDATAATLANWPLIGGAGKPADYATVGSTAGVDLKTNGGVIYTDVQIGNGYITIGSNGSLSGAGGGQVTVPGLETQGYGPVQNNALSMDVDTGGTGGRGRVLLRSSGGTGFGTQSLPEVVQNLGISVSSNVISGIGTGTGTAVANAGVSIAANGALSGAGGGQVTIGGLGYTGSLNATADITFGGHGIYTQIGNGGFQTGTTGTARGLYAMPLTGPMFAEMNIAVGAYYTALAFAPTGTATSTSAMSAYGAYRNSDGAYQLVYAAGTIATGTATAGLTGKLQLIYDGAKVYLYAGGTLIASSAAPAGLTGTTPNYPKFFFYESGVTYTGFNAGVAMERSWANFQNRPSNLAALAGTEGINNAAVSIGSNGALSGGGGGQVTLGGIGFSGDTDAQRNSRIGITAGKLTNNGTNLSSAFVANDYVSVNGLYLTTDGGTTNSTAAINNGGISIGSNGTLAGGAGGQVTLRGVGFTGDTNATAGQNLIQNPNSEDATPSGYGALNVYTGTGYSSNKCRYLTGASGYIPVAEVPAQDGDQIYIAGFCRGSSGTSTAVTPAVAWYDSAGTLLRTDGYYWGNYSAVSGIPAYTVGLTWTKVAMVSAAAPAGAVTARLQFYFQNGTDGALIDNMYAQRLASMIVGQAPAATDATIEGSADVTKAASGPATAALNYASDATTLTSTVPKPITGFALTPAGGSAFSSGVTWAASVLSGSFSGTAPSASGTGAGTLTLNSGLASADAVIAMTPTYGGKTYPPAVIKITKTIAAAAVQGGATSGAYAASSVSLALATAYTAATPSMTVTIGSGGSAALAASGNIYSDAGTSCTVSVKWQRESSPGTWADVGSAASVTVPGNTSRSYNATATYTGTGSQNFRVVANYSSNVGPVSIDGNATVQG